MDSRDETASVCRNLPPLDGSIVGIRVTIPSWLPGSVYGDCRSGPAFTVVARDVEANAIRIPLAFVCAVTLRALRVADAASHVSVMPVAAPTIKVDPSVRRS